MARGGAARRARAAAGARALGGTSARFSDAPAGMGAKAVQSVRASENLLIMGAFYRKLSYNGRILAKTVFLWAHFSENCLFWAAKVRNFAKMPGKSVKFR